MNKEVILKSCDPVSYPDEVVICRVIENEDINAYLATIPEDKKIFATKTAPVVARDGIPGEVIHTTLLTERNGQMYILSEEDNTVSMRAMPNGEEKPDKVVTNVNSTSNEQYVVKATKFPSLYPEELMGLDGTYTPAPDTRLLTQVDEDIIIKTAWGSEAVCLAGSYIVTYDAASNDFNTLERGAFESTYSTGDGKKM